MSKAISSVTKAVFGGGGSTGALGTGQFKASTRNIDKEAFKIKGSEEAASKSKELQQSAEQRSSEAQANRSKLITDLQKQASGEAPSLAEAQLKSASDRSLAQQLAAAQSQRGGSAAARQRNLMQSQAQAGRETAQDAATARMQEQQAAQQMLGEQVSQEQQLADQLTQNYLAQGFNIEAARQAALSDYERLATDQHLAAQKANLSGFQSAAASRGALAGGFTSGISNVLSNIGISDVNAKEKIKKAKSSDIGKKIKEKTMENTKIKNPTEAKEEKEKKKKTFSDVLKETNENKEMSGQERAGTLLGAAAGEGLKKLFSDERVKKNKEALSDKNIKKDFLDKLTAYKYEYKDEFKNNPKAGHGEQLSVMAQDLEKAGPIGKSMVSEDESGVKAVDYAKGYGAILAAQAHLNKRLDEIEKKGNNKKKK